MNDPSTLKSAYVAGLRRAIAAARAQADHYAKHRCDGAAWVVSKFAADLESEADRAAEHIGSRARGGACDCGDTRGASHPGNCPVWGPSDAG